MKWERQRSVADPRRKQLELPRGGRSFIALQQRHEQRTHHQLATLAARQYGVVTREQLVGYYMVEARDLDEASAIAARIPGAKFGSVEVRPIWMMG